MHFFAGAIFFYFYFTFIETSAMNSNRNYNMRARCNEIVIEHSFITLGKLVFGVVMLYYNR